MWEIPACPFAMSHSCQIWYTTKIVPQYFLYNKKTNEWFRVQLKEQDWCGVALWSVLGVCVIHSWPFKEWCFSSKRSFFFMSLYICGSGRTAKEHCGKLSSTQCHCLCNWIRVVQHIPCAKIAEDCVLLHVVESWISPGKGLLCLFFFPVYVMISMNIKTCK